MGLFAWQMDRWGMEEQPGWEQRLGPAASPADTSNLVRTDRGETEIRKNWFAISRVQMVQI